VTVLFARYNGVDISASNKSECKAAIEKGQQVMLHVQHAVYTWEGSINKFMVDEKGMSALCVFGLPPMAHADDAKRATAAAKMMVESVEELGLGASVSIGITTGLVYCGVIGSEERREVGYWGWHLVFPVC
jgi:class 3 adenylate cyclase